MQMMMNSTRRVVRVDVTSQSNYNLFTDLTSTKKLVPLTAAGAQAWNTDVIVNIPAGVTVGSASVATPSFDVGSMVALRTSLYLINNGNIDGRGGLANSGVGGDALKTTILMKVDNQSNVRAGGGGGGKGETADNAIDKSCISLPGGNGGKGQGSDGAQASGVAGTVGSICASGAGGNGGTFGNAGSNGGNATGTCNICNNGDQAAAVAGGAAGNYANGASKITWVNNGTRSGNTTG